ncbi:MAG TPA: transferrin receptor-like dimerization domain-containing protein [Flavilitoribacter sp.]|nr:transferrin receptor-like dimerization domain-containing protein [Flavilitoribacter sp.]
MKPGTILSAFILLFICSSLTPLVAQITGFSPDQAAAQEKLEKQFDAQLKASDLDQWMKQLSLHPHHVGSPWDKANAEFMAAQFKSWGFDTRIEEYQVLFPTPKSRLLEMVGPTKFKAGLTEPPVKGDASSQQTAEMLPPFNCYSIDGDVTGELVFVNYGIPADYEELEKRGIDVKGKIVIAKYYGSWRGIKPKVAAEKGAIGCIIYSDPREDGYFQGDVYPKGAYKNADGVQRGSVLDMPLFPGDPLTPGYGATKDAKRVPVGEAETLTKIPVLPISYEDAQPLLAALEGPVAPSGWRGALPITYHIGPGPAKVHLKLEFNWDVKPLYNVIATMKGSAYPDQWVIRGNHHDAWVHGANDPVSGMVAVMEEAKAVGELVKTGWKPKRTLIYCGWDGEEPGLLGSTEWAENHAGELQQKAVAYINTDGNGRGFLGGGGSHTLEKYFDEVSKAVTDPQTGLTVFERRKARMMVDGQTEPKFYELSALGSGSDYTPFIQHLGIASINLGFGGESGGGEYHTGYDSYEHYTRFKDIGFEYGVALAKVAGRLTLRLSEAEVLPFEFQHFSQTVSKYADEVMKLADRLRDETAKENRLITDGYYKAAADPTETFIVPETKEEVPYFNWAPLQNALAELKKSVAAYDEAMKAGIPAEKQREALNLALMKMEQSLTREEGLPRRPWFRHQIYAPGFYTGYGVKTLPGIREAIEERKYDEAQEQILIAGQVLSKFAREVMRAAELLKRA